MLHFNVETHLFLLCIPIDLFSIKHIQNKAIKKSYNIL